MIYILTWVAIITGGLLILLMLLSLIGGLELDVEIGSTDVETDAGGIGLIKGFLTFLSIGSWVMKVTIVTSDSPIIALFVGLVSGVLAFFVLNYLFKLLLKNESNVNWNMDDALFQVGEVYLKIPAKKGNGIITVDINGTPRELKAKAEKNKEIPTGAKIMVVRIEGEYALVEAYNNSITSK